jgi:hypothetical protein
MQNDFLSSLSSRALQNPVVEAPARELQPRLASRFENLEAPVASAAYQAPNPENFVEVDAEGPRRPMPVQGQSRTRVVQKDLIPNQRSEFGLLTVPERRFEESEHFLKGAETLTVPNPRRPMLVEDQVDMSPILPVSVERSAFSSSPRRNEDIQEPEISPLPDRASFGENPDKTSETHLETAQLPSPSSDPRSAAPPLGLPADLPGIQPKIIPERIEITRLERQLPLPANGSQIVPSLDLPRLKTQSTTPEAQEQPPTIHVAIGRIEVKAAPPVAAPKRRASASPTMSLDEYLRRRSGGER